MSAILPMLILFPEMVMGGNLAVNQAMLVGADAEFVLNPPTFETSVIDTVNTTYAFERLQVAHNYRMVNTTIMCCDTTMDMLDMSTFCPLVHDMRSSILPMEPGESSSLTCQFTCPSLIAPCHMT